MFPWSGVYNKNNDIIKATSAAVYLPPKSSSFEIHVLGKLVIITKAGKLDLFYHKSEDCRFKEKQFHRIGSEKSRKFAIFSIKSKSRVLHSVEKTQNGKKNIQPHKE